MGGLLLNLLEVAGGQQIRLTGAFAGLNVSTPWYNLTIGLAMLIGRFLFLIPLLAAAGSLASGWSSAAAC